MVNRERTFEYTLELKGEINISPEDLKSCYNNSISSFLEAEGEDHRHFVEVKSWKEIA